MQSFNSYLLSHRLRCGIPEIPFWQIFLFCQSMTFQFSDMDFKVFSSSSHFSGTLLPDEAPGENTSSINVSSHIFEGLCIRFVIVIQYEKSILYTYDTFSEIGHFFLKSCSPSCIFKFFLPKLISFSSFLLMTLFRLTSDKCISFEIRFQLTKRIRFSQIFFFSK